MLSNDLCVASTVLCDYSFVSFLWFCRFSFFLEHRLPQLCQHDVTSKDIGIGRHSFCMILKGVGFFLKFLQQEWCFSPSHHYRRHKRNKKQQAFRDERNNVVFCQTKRHKRKNNSSIICNRQKRRKKKKQGK